MLNIDQFLNRILTIFFQTDISRKKSFETLKKEFELAIVLDFIRAGVEAIIEDEVTSRFEAEELKVCSLFCI